MGALISEVCCVEMNDSIDYVDVIAHTPSVRASSKETSGDSNSDTDTISNEEETPLAASMDPEYSNNSSKSGKDNIIITGILVFKLLNHVHIFVYFK